MRRGEEQKSKKKPPSFGAECNPLEPFRPVRCVLQCMAAISVTVPDPYAGPEWATPVLAAVRTVDGAGASGEPSKISASAFNTVSVRTSRVFPIESEGFCSYTILHAAAHHFGPWSFDGRQHRRQ